MPEAQQAVWNEVRAQVRIAGTYSPANLTAFRVLVRTITLLDQAPPDMAATALVRLAQTASSLLTSFGLTPISRERVPQAPAPHDPTLDDF